MRIAYLAAGAAGMYCGSCLHDNTLAAALLKLGEDVVLVPIYTPIRTDERDVSEPRVFFGGINAYLQQKFPLFRRTPRWLDGWLDHPALLRLVARARRERRPGEARRHDRLDAPRRGGQPAQGARQARRLADRRGAARRGAPVQRDDAGAGAADRRALRAAGGLLAVGRGHFSGEARAAALRAGARSCCASGRRTSNAFVALNGYYADLHGGVPRRAARSGCT